MMDYLSTALVVASNSHPSASNKTVTTIQLDDDEATDDGTGAVITTAASPSDGTLALSEPKGLDLVLHSSASELSEASTCTSKDPTTATTSNKTITMKPTVTTIATTMPKTLATTLPKTLALTTSSSIETRDQASSPRDIQQASSSSPTALKLPSSSFDGSTNSNSTATTLPDAAHVHAHPHADHAHSNATELHAIQAQLSLEVQKSSRLEEDLKDEKGKTEYLRKRISMLVKLMLKKEEELKRVHRQLQKQQQKERDAAATARSLSSVPTSLVVSTSLASNSLLSNSVVSGLSPTSHMTPNSNGNSTLTQSQPQPPLQSQPQPPLQSQLTTITIPRPSSTKSSNKLPPPPKLPPRHNANANAGAGQSLHLTDSHSTASRGDDSCSLDSEQMKIRIEAAKVLFRASQSMSPEGVGGRRNSFSANSIANSNVNANAPHSRRSNNRRQSSLPKMPSSSSSSLAAGGPKPPPSSKARPKSSRTAAAGQLPQMPSSSAASRTNHATTVNKLGEECSCSMTVLTQNHDPSHVDFFLPKLDFSCQCMDCQRGLKGEGCDPSLLSSILRPWQVDFLHALHIRTIDDLLRAKHKNTKGLVKAMMKWREVRQMTKVKKKSCFVAIHIWTRTATVIKRSLKSGNEPIRFLNEISLNPKDDDDDTTVSTLGCPDEMEV